MQPFERKNRKIEDQFKAIEPKRPIRFSWSNWGFGREPLADGLERLAEYEVRFVELHGNHYGPDLGYRAKDVKHLLARHDMAVSGICGMFSAENDLSSTSAASRQAAVDYLRREIDFAYDVGASYILVVPGAVGRPKKYDDYEFDRSVDTVRLVADKFLQSGVRAAIEPIRAAEVSFCNTVADAKRYIEAVDHPGVAHINGDVYHMQSGESHIASAILEAGDKLANLHLADSNRTALGLGSMDYAAIIRALHILQAGGADLFVSAEPLGPGGDPYPAMHSAQDSFVLDQLVSQSVRHFREVEQELIGDGLEG